ncbi:MAG: 1-acyl-sn-glycerol-3-phosphate acyltransferase [Myxococcales bacterium]|nr:1-acyl-sn-glycerol-3-phosphate acyltransferase [Myxococcales bacterium]
MSDPRHLDPDDIARDDELLGRAAERIGPVLDFWFTPEIRGVERLPAGPALLVGNHNGGSMSPDSFVIGVALYRALGAKAVPYWLAHDMVVSLPLFRQVVPLGVVRASSAMAHAVFAAGRKVLVYPGGEEDTLRPWAERDRIIFAGRTGYVRLALREGVPVVPVVVAGAHEVFMVIGGGPALARMLLTKTLFRVKTWPLTLSLPWGLTPGPPPLYLPFPVRMLGEVLDPIHFEKVGPEAAADEAYVRRCDDLVRARMQAALLRLAAERRETGRYAFTSGRWRADEFMAEPESESGGHESGE